MAITIYTGIPRSGKTYKMVADLNREKGDYYVVHNIDGLVPELLGDYGLDFVEYCQKNGMEVQEFFSKEYQIKFCDAVKEKYGRNVLVIIDECHEWFDRNVKSLKMWLSYHGHLNQTIWLVAHRSSNIPSVYRSFIECEYRAKHNSLVSLPGVFMYNRVLGGQRVGYKFEKKDSAIFALYKSQRGEKPAVRKKSFLVPVFVLVVALAFIVFVNVPKFFGTVASAEKAKTGGNDPKAVEKAKTGIPAKAAGPAGPADVQPAVAVKIEDRFAFVGGDESFMVFEERLTGEQVTFDRLPGVYMVVEVRRGNFARLYSMTEKREVEFVNTRRASDRRARAERSGSAGSPRPGSKVFDVEQVSAR